MTQLINKGHIKQIISMLIFSILLTLIVSTNSNVEASNSDIGYFTSAQDLATIRQEFLLGNEPISSLVYDFLNRADAPTEWNYGVAGFEYVVSNDDCLSLGYSNSDEFIEQRDGAQAIYEKMIAYHLTHNIDYAIVARQKLLDLSMTYGYGGDYYSGGNDCILELAFSVPAWIQAADLLESTSIWTQADKLAFQSWLANEVYEKVAWASRVRQNNWGSTGSVASSMIADYLLDTNTVLIEIEPVYLELTPAQAYNQHNQQQLARMNTEWQGDSQCEIWGIQSYGGIPDELRRGDAGCEARWIEVDDNSHMYQITQIEHLVTHAEFLRRRGDYSIFSNINSDGSGSVLNAILFVIDNPVMSQDWTLSKLGVLTVANRYYQHPSLDEEIGTSTIVRAGSMLSYSTLTHALEIDDVPEPTVEPTLVPTNTVEPTLVPTNTVEPTLVPTNTVEPTVEPTFTPTNTVEPTVEPTNTVEPTPMPTNTLVPTVEPTVVPTNTLVPTNTTVPTLVPTNTLVPTLVPTNTTMPTLVPTNTTVPTLVPTNTTVPTLVPTNTLVPTLVPTNTTMPTLVPTNTPMPTLDQMYLGAINVTVNKDRSQWQAFVIVTVTQASGLPASGATVTGTWSSDNTIVSCVTATDGTCTLISTEMHMSQNEIILNITSLTHPDMIYIPLSTTAPSISDSNPNSIISIVISKND